MAAMGKPRRFGGVEGVEECCCRCAGAHLITVPLGAYC